MKSIYSPRKASFYGAPITPMVHGETWLEGEEMNRDYGHFNRRGLVRHSVTKQLVKVRADVPDSFFSIPATTDTEPGYVTSDEKTGELEFRPVKYETDPKKYRADIRKAYK